ncbi:MAG TPA: NUDIX domain-containing protein [Stellaceae bacterium]|nr:NUDIX domain-containing protein [Stellaceae bacterium]
MTDGPRSLLDGLWRIAYWLAFRLLRCWWFLRRPHHQGALVAVWHEGRVLMLTPSYRKTLDFPGGGRRRGEGAAEAAARELAEETGIRAAPTALALTLEMTVFWHWRYDEVAVFELRLAEPPAIRVDGREIVAARFMAPEAALAAPLSPFVRAYLRAGAVA